MSSEDRLQDRKREVGNGRNPLFILAGFGLLGIALTLLVFGDSFFGNVGTTNGADETILQQVPAFNSAEAASFQQSSANRGALEVGTPAYDFTLNDLDGNAVQLNDFVGRPVIINFWATWCVPCRDEMPELEAAFQAHREDGLVVLAVNQQEPKESVAQFFDELDLTFTPLLDIEGTVASLYRVANMLPTTFFINAEGSLTAIHRGPLNQSQIDTYLLQEVP